MTRRKLTNQKMMSATGLVAEPNNSHASINVTVPVLSAQSPVGLPHNENPHHMKNSPVRASLQEGEVRKIVAARIIERAWLSFRDKQMFRLLKHAICAAEHSLSHEILKKVCPQEAEFCKDPGLQLKVRFRFGGIEFPPEIYFKIYTASGGVKYISGKRILKPTTQAARDACDLMGNRKYYDIMIQDAVQRERFRITDEVDVTTLKDYMQYMSLMDEMPAYMGGRDNLWRKLTLDALSRTTIFYDILDFAVNGNKMSDRLQQQVPLLLMRPLTQDIQIEHMRAISEHRAIPITPPATCRSVRSKQSQISGRRSKQARVRAMKMQKMYREGSEQEHMGISHDIAVKDDDEEEWEEEAHKLYEWTQELTFDEIATPRYPSFVKESSFVQ